MAKGNMLLGYNRGKLGDIVFKRLNGQSVQVPRVRNPHNPRTDAQSIQRIAFSSATKMAQCLRGIVDHSFQGIKYGQMSVNHFVSRLTKEIKESALTALDDVSAAPFGTAPILPYVASGVAPGASALVSNGDLRGMEFKLAGTSEGGLIVGNVVSASIMSVATVAEYESLFGVPPTDQVTILEAQPEELEYVSETELFYGARFDYLRWNLRQDIADSTLLFHAGASEGEYQLNPAALDMERTDPRVPNIVITVVSDGLRLCTGSSTSNSGDVCGNGLASTVCLAGVIVSRYESGIWRRSVTRLARTPKTITQSAVSYEENYAWNDVRSVLELNVAEKNVPEDEYLNKKKVR